MRKRKYKILFVEDDKNLSEVTNDLLAMSGYSIKLCGDGEEALIYFRKLKFDLCIFDIMLPKIDGFELAEEIRQINREIPIIFLTAKNLKEDKIRGFKVGCDDYITKPFSGEELVLRIEAIMKRCISKERMGDDDKPIQYKFAGFNFDYTNMLLKWANGERKLTKKESELLKFFLNHQNKIVTREDTLMTVWGTDSYFIGRSMDVFVTKLRKYLEMDPKVKIANIHGIGFKFEIDK
ncbi:MAG: response regulator transcription factor [Bacteroidales bacterium]|nr:response regulator transcription factor [Bacteroidales bacterium]